MGLKKLLYRSKYFLSPHLNLKKPVDVTLELSSVCNHKCTYCYHNVENTAELPFNKGMMNFETAQRILDQAYALGVNSVKFNWRGESHLNPDFYQITEYAGKLKFLDRISNSNFNFNSIRKDIFEAFKNQTKIKISFDSFIKEVFEVQRPGSNFDRIFENINTFYKYYMTSKNEVVLQMVRTKLNKRENLESLKNKYWPKMKISIRDCVSNRAGGAKELSNEMPKKRVPCYQAFSRLIFDHTGRATCCCPDIKTEILSIDYNIKRMNLIDIWNSFELKSLRYYLKNGAAFQREPCKSCSSLESYEGYKFNWRS